MVLVLTIFRGKCSVAWLTGTNPALERVDLSRSDVVIFLLAPARRAEGITAGDRSGSGCCAMNSQVLAASIAPPVPKGEALPRPRGLRGRQVTVRPQAQQYRVMLRPRQHRLAFTSPTMPAALGRGGTRLRTCVRSHWPARARRQTATGKKGEARSTHTRPSLGRAGSDGLIRGRQNILQRQPPIRTSTPSVIMSYARRAGASNLITFAINQATDPGHESISASPILSRP